MNNNEETLTFDDLNVNKEEKIDILFDEQPTPVVEQVSPIIEEVTPTPVVAPVIEEITPTPVAAPVIEEVAPTPVIEGFAPLPTSMTPEVKPAPEVAAPVYKEVPASILEAAPKMDEVVITAPVYNEVSASMADQNKAAGITTETAIKEVEKAVPNNLNDETLKTEDKIVLTPEEIKEVKKDDRKKINFIIFLLVVFGIAIIMFPFVSMLLER